MIILLLLSIPLIGILFISTRMYYHNSTFSQGVDSLQENPFSMLDISLPD